MYSPTLNKIKLSGLIVIPILLLLLPASFFDEGQSVCLSVLLLDIECYGCGMTRAIMHIIHFDFSTAWTYNKIAFIVFPIMVYLYVEFFLKEFAFYKKYQKEKQSK